MLNVANNLLMLSVIMLNVVMLSVVAPSTVDLLIKIVFGKIVNNVCIIKSSLSILVSTRRSTVLSLPLQCDFPHCWLSYILCLPHVLIVLYFNYVQVISKLKCLINYIVESLLRLFL
jgi:hypothetical protein